MHSTPTIFLLALLFVPWLVLAAPLDPIVNPRAELAVDAPPERPTPSAGVHASAQPAESAPAQKRAPMVLSTEESAESLEKRCVFACGQTGCSIM